MKVLLAGVGAVGTRAARQLVDTPGVSEVLLADADADRMRTVAEALGHKASVHAFAPGDPIPAGVDVVACALPTGLDHAVAAAVITAGVPMVSTDDDHDAIESIRALERNAAGAGVTIALGCGFAHIEGYPVAILANRGILFAQSSQKGAHFIELAAKRLSADVVSV